MQLVATILDRAVPYQIVVVTTQLYTLVRTHWIICGFGHIKDLSSTLVEGEVQK